MGGFAPVPRVDPTLISGMRDSSQENAYRVKIDMDDEIHIYDQDVAPLLTLTGAIKRSRTVENPLFDWLSLDPYPNTATGLSAATSGDTAIVLAAGEGNKIKKYDCLQNLTSGEVIYVQSVATDTLTVLRAIGGGAASVLAGDIWLILATANEDGATIGTLKSLKADRSYNYTQIIREGVGWTRRDANTAMYGGSDPETTKAAKMREFKIKIEKTAFFGRRDTRTGLENSKPVTFTGGLEYFIATNVWDVNGTRPDPAAFTQFMESAFRYGKGGFNGSSTKYLFASPAWMSLIESFATSKLAYQPLGNVDVGGKGIKVGLKAASFVSTHGEIMLMREPLFVGPRLGGMAFLVDLNHIRKVNLKGGGIQYLKDRQQPSQDGVMEEWLADIGWQVDLEASHAILKGLPATGV